MMKEVPEYKGVAQYPKDFLMAAEKFSSQFGKDSDSTVDKIRLWCGDRGNTHLNHSLKCLGIRQVLRELHGLSTAPVSAYIGRPPNAPLLLLNRMARRLHVTVAWLRSEADAGRVPCLRAGDRYLFAPDAVESVLAERAAKSYEALT